MPEYINNVQTQDAYSTAATFQPDVYTTQIVFDIGNNPVLIQVWREDSTLEGKVVLDENEALYTAGLGYILEDVAGFRVRSANAGSPAQLIAKRFLQADQKLTPGLAFTGTIQASGTLQPDIPPASPLVQVEHNGGAAQGPEAALNLIDAAGSAGVPGLAWTVADNAPAGRVDVTPVLSLTGVPVLLGDSGVLGGAAGTIDFSGLPATFMRLVVLFYGRTSGAVTVGDLLMRLNNDSGANYDNTSYYLDQAGNLNTDSLAQNQSAITIGQLPGSSANANLMGVATIELVGYASTVFNKVAHANGYASSSGTVERREISGGRWGNTAAVNRVTLLPATGNFVAGSRAVIYGM